jgi:hypothetical protein
MVVIAAALAIVGYIALLNHTGNGREYGTGGSVAHP